MGRGSEVGQVLLDDKRANAISFTGPVATGRRIAQACVALHGQVLHAAGAGITGLGSEEQIVPPDREAWRDYC